MNIVIRADASSELGLGHLMRSYALTLVLKKKWQVLLLVKSSIRIPSEIMQLADSLKILEDGDAQDFLAYIQSDTVAVLDGNHFDPTFQGEISRKAHRLLLVTDLIGLPHRADAVLNIGDFKGDGKTSSAFYFHGPQYSLLRPEFLRSSNRNSIPGQVLLCLGGSDPFGLTPKLISAIEMTRFHVANLAITKSIQGSDLRSDHFPVMTHVGLNGKEMNELMASSCHIISTASVTALEACAVRKSLAIGVAVDNQENGYKGIVDAGAAFGLGHFIHSTIEELSSKLSSFFSSAPQKWEHAQSQLIGDPEKNIVDMIEILSATK